jgi:hypothetical protein
MLFLAVSKFFFHAFELQILNALSAFKKSHFGNPEQGRPYPWVTIAHKKK